MEAPRRHYISSFIRKCKFVQVSRRSAGPHLAWGPIGSNRSNRLRAGPTARQSLHYASVSKWRRFLATWDVPENQTRSQVKSKMGQNTFLGDKFLFVLCLKQTGKSRIANWGLRCPRMPPGATGMHKTNKSTNVVAQECIRDDHYPVCPVDIQQDSFQPDTDIQKPFFKQDPRIQIRISEPKRCIR